VPCVRSSAANQERLIGLTTPELWGGRGALSSSAANQERLVGLTTPELRGGRAVETLDVGMRKILYTVMGYYKKIL
jgi:hypothetical protein